MLYFKLSEFIHSETAIIHKINNMPDINSLDHLLDLIFYVMQPLRDKARKPIIITSGYRNQQVNKLICGALNSQHTNGQACDFIIKGLPVSSSIDFIKKSGIVYDQLINEYDKWVHISFVKGKNRMMLFQI